MELQLSERYTRPQVTSSLSEEQIDPVARLASERFGIPYLLPLQRMAIANVLDAGEGDASLRQLVLFPTGFGKSLCFQLPSLLLDGLTLVIYPLLALMNDQLRSLKARGIGCACFRGGMSPREWKAEESKLLSGHVAIAITNPESMASPKLIRFLSGMRIAHVAVDEAHCICEWGETFRPAYIDLGRRLAALPSAAVSAFTATASPAVEATIARVLFGAQPYSVVTAQMDKPNIRYSVEPSLSPIHTLMRLVLSKPRPMVVFARSRDTTRRLCEEIRRRTPHTAWFYHAGLERAEKEETERRFMESADAVLVATCAYGMGVDKRDVRTVIHYGEPPSVEAYLQESGRAGRDGGAAEAVLIPLGGPGRRTGDAPGAAGSEAAGSCSPGAAKGALANGSQGDACGRIARSRAMLEYSIAAGCRRLRLLKALGREEDSPCSGCDSCDRTRRDEAEGLSELIEFLGANDGRFDTRTAISMLGWTASRHDPRGPRNLPVCRGAGLLEGWEEKDISYLVKAALDIGVIERRTRRFGTDRLGLPLKRSDLRHIM